MNNIGERKRPIYDKARTARERRKPGIRYLRRQIDEGVGVLKNIKLNYSAGSGLPAPTCSPGSISSAWSFN